MTRNKLSLGQAIDQIIGALEALESEARRTAVETVCAHLKITIGAATGGRPADPKALALKEDSSGRPAAVPPIAPPAPRSPTDIRSLRTEKNPRSAREMACVVAFYLQELAPEGERKETVSTADLEKFFKQAHFKLPEKLAQVLVDAKGSGYFDSAARGAYKLNAVGYNLVAHKLPATAGGA